MASRRTTGIADNQSMFRMVNERVTSWPERQAAPSAERLMFYCECADPKCFERVFLTAGEYEAIRAESTHFVVVEGYLFPEAERVVAERNGHQVVEKNDDLRGGLERTDPRNGAHP
jgi:hypothetical protein